MAEGKSGSKNAIPHYDRKSFFAKFVAIPLLKYCNVDICYV